MHDLISRQAAIDALGEKPLAWTEGEYELGLQNQWQSDVDALSDLPSAQPESQWIPCSDENPKADGMAEKLLAAGRLRITGCKSRKTGKTYDTTLVLETDADGRAVFHMEFGRADKKSTENEGRSR